MNIILETRGNYVFSLKYIYIHVYCVFILFAILRSMDESMNRTTQHINSTAFLLSGLCKCVSVFGASECVCVSQILCAFTS